MGKLLLQRSHRDAFERRYARRGQESGEGIGEQPSRVQSARETYSKAVEPLKQEVKKYGRFIEAGDPPKAEPDALDVTMLDAQIQQGVAEYELGETYPDKSPERTKSLKDAFTQFDTIYKEHREQWAGLAAHVAGQVLRRAGRDRPCHRHL